MAKGKDTPPLDASVRQSVALRRLLAQLGGAKLCFGEPVRVGEREVIPVARVRTRGGGGIGADGAAGGGGLIDASPIGFIDAGPEGARFESIPDPDAQIRLIKGGATAVATLLTTIAGARALRCRSSGALRGGPRGLLNR